MALTNGYDMRDELLHTDREMLLHGLSRQVITTLATDQDRKSRPKKQKKEGRNEKGNPN